MPPSVHISYVSSLNKNISFVIQNVYITVLRKDYRPHILFVFAVVLFHRQRLYLTTKKKIRLIITFIYHNISIFQNLSLLFRAVNIAVEFGHWNILSMTIECYALSKLISLLGLKLHQGLKSKSFRAKIFHSSTGGKSMTELCMAFLHGTEKMPSEGKNLKNLWFRLQTNEQTMACFR